MTAAADLSSRTSCRMEEKFVEMLDGMMREAEPNEDEEDFSVADV